jgi:ADP-ribosylglycohydrolase
MSYPKTSDLKSLVEEIELYSQLKAEYGAAGLASILSDTRQELRASLARLKKLPVDKKRSQQEPDDLPGIQSLRPAGPRRLWQGFEKNRYSDKVEGALLGRLAGCTLGAPVEFWSIEKMQALAIENGDAFPPTDYWSRVPEPELKRYQVSPRKAYTRKGIAGVPVDDDIVYTLLGLLIIEEHGIEFTVEDVGKAWLKYLPYACTAEEVALKNLKKGVPARLAGASNNPYCEWIGADIRSDSWAYVAPGWPERAAIMAYRDACISHRRQGVYGEMFFAAAIAAAFHVDDPVEALRIGLTEIPRDCTLSKEIRWALRVSPEIRDYKHARAAVESRFSGMSHAHTINNACLTVWAITIGGTDFSRVIGEAVAMGMDNDCTAATAGSIVGAVVGKKDIPVRWYENFDNKIYSYLIGKKKFTISGVVSRFEKQARRVHR